MKWKRVNPLGIHPLLKFYSAILSAGGPGRMMALILLTGFFMGAPAQAVSISKEFWIQSGAAGSNLGTLSDPFDGSTQAKFDSLMSSLTSTNSNVVIHLLPGTYFTGGNPATWYLRSNSRLLGSGIDITTIKIADNGPNGAWAVTSDNGVTNLEVADMTLDVNGQSNSSLCASGVSIVGTKSAIRRVKVINPIGGGCESFPIYIHPADINPADPRYIPPELCTGNTIEDCVVSNVLGTVGSAIGVAGGEATIMNCRVYLPPANTNGAWSAFNCPFFNGLKLIGNYSDGGTYGFYIDTGAATNALISHNVFRNCAYGVSLNNSGAMVDGVSILDNLIVLPTNEWLFHNSGVVSAPPTRNLTISGNTIRTTDPTRVSADTAIQLFNSTGAVIQGNRWDANLGFESSSNTNLVVFNNFDLSGNAFANVDQVTIVNGVLTVKGTALTDSSGKVVTSALNTVTTAAGGLGLDASAWAADLFPYTTGTGTFGSASITSFGRTLVASADAASAQAALGLAPGPSTAYKTSDQSFGTTTADVTDLSFPVEANKDYRFNFVIVVSTSGTTQGYQLTLRGPGTPAELSATMEVPNANTTVKYMQLNTYGTLLASDGGPGTSARWVARITGTLRNGSSAGNLVVQARAQSVSNGLTVKKGSWGEFMKMN